MRLAPPADLLRDDPELAVVEPSRCSSSPVSVKADAWCTCILVRAYTSEMRISCMHQLSASASAIPSPSVRRHLSVRGHLSLRGQLSAPASASRSRARISCIHRGTLGRPNQPSLMGYPCVIAVSLCT